MESLTKFRSFNLRFFEYQVVNIFTSYPALDNEFASFHTRGLLTRCCDVNIVIEFLIRYST